MTDCQNVIDYFEGKGTCRYSDELRELSALAFCFSGGVKIKHVKAHGTDCFNNEVSPDPFDSYRSVSYEISASRRTLR